MNYLQQKITLLALIFIIPAFAMGKDNILNIYAWNNFLPNEVVYQFTKETGIKVNLIGYDNNETMFTKLKTLSRSDYDIALPSSYYVERMIKHNMLQPLDKKKLDNFKHLEPWLLNQEFDPKNRYSIPYSWGTTCIVINTKYIPKGNTTRWQDLWDVKYKNQLLMLNDLRDVFSISLLSLGYSINDQNPKHIEQAYLKLKELLPNVKIFGADGITNIYIDEDAHIGTTWSGSCKLAQDENPNLEYIYPEEGFPIWLDNFVIIKHAPHADNAHKFINFISRPDIAKKVTMLIGHSTANRSALKLLPKEIQNNRTTNPSRKIMQRGKIQLDLSDETRHLYEKYWERLKIGS